jgi:hypothetical protein
MVSGFSVQVSALLVLTPDTRTTIGGVFEPMSYEKDGPGPFALSPPFKEQGALDGTFAKPDQCTAMG